ncbi:MAG: Hsp20/alpha crystallin family protein [Armatimonadota bacterium]|nr:Hsp20/alpha crystallin family protein [Armatimonadota bacterium]
MRSRPSEQGFQPPTDIYETGDAMVVRMEIAGMSAEEIGISVDESAGRLTITGVREDPAREEPKRYFNVEIECGEFMRVVQLARPVSVEEAAASYESGFLVVRLPFRSETGGKPRSVPIE